MSISVIGWIVVGVTAWLVVAGVVAVLIGRMIRQRDRQVPQDRPPASPPGVPVEGADPHATRSPSAMGRGRQRRT